MARLLSSSEGSNLDAFTAADWTRFVAISVIWGSSFLLIAFGLDAYTPGLVTWGRVALGAGALWLVPRARRPVDRADWPRLVALSFTWVAVPFTLFPIAQQWITSALTGMLNGAMPIFAAVIATLMLHRRPGPRQVAGLVLGLVGVVLIGLPALGSGGNQAIGAALVLVAIAFYGLSVNLAVPVTQAHGSLPVMARVLALATIWTLPMGVVGLPGIAPEAVPTAAVVVLGVVGTGLAFALMAGLSASVGSTRASFITYFIPVVALVLGVTIRGEDVSPVSLVGVVAVVVGAILASRADRVVRSAS